MTELVPPTGTIRIGTWNVEYANPARNPQRLALMNAANADVWVLTETRDALDLGNGYRPIHSDVRPRVSDGGRWVTVWARFSVVERISVKDPCRTVAALYDTPLGHLLLYGTVLPWHSDRGPTGYAKNWTEHHRVIPEQAAEWSDLTQRHPHAALCVAGDLNMSLGGGYYYGTRRGREMLNIGLSKVGLTCVTRTEQVPLGKLTKPHIDHVCVPNAWANAARVVDAWPGNINGIRLSDHSAVVVELHSRARETCRANP